MNTSFVGVKLFCLSMNFFFLAFVVWSSKCMDIDLANRLVWNWLRFSTWRSKVVSVEAPHFGGLFKTTLLDSNALERYWAWKKFPTLLLDRTTTFEIENGQDTPKSLCANPWLPCIIALDIEFWWKKFDSTIISMLDTPSGHRPPKSDIWLLHGYTR